MSTKPVTISAESARVILRNFYEGRHAFSLGELQDVADRLSKLEAVAEAAEAMVKSWMLAGPYHDDQIMETGPKADALRAALDAAKEKP